MKTLLVSACLAGLRVRYNGLDSLDSRIAKKVKAVGVFGEDEWEDAVRLLEEVNKEEEK